MSLKLLVDKKQETENREIKLQIKNTEIIVPVTDMVKRKTQYIS